MALFLLYIRGYFPFWTGKFLFSVCPDPDAVVYFGLRTKSCNFFWTESVLPTNDEYNL